MQKMKAKLMSRVNPWRAAKCQDPKICLLAAILGASAVFFGPNVSAGSLTVSDDQKKGVKSEIFLLMGDGTDNRLGQTGEDGVFTFPGDCNPGERIEGRPISELYYPSRTECPVQGAVLLVTRKAYLRNLLENAERLANSGEHGKASLVYNEIAARAKGFDPELADRSAMKAYENFASELTSKHGAQGIDDAVMFDVEQNRYVISSELMAAITAFQARADLAPTGVLDYGTLSAAAETPINPYIFEQLDPSQF